MRSRRSASPGRSGRLTILSAFVVVVVSAAIGAAATPGASSSGTSSAAAPHTSTTRGSSSANLALLPSVGGFASGGGGAPGVAQAATPVSGVVGRAAVHTMSMDAPIQGGLTAHQEQALSARLLRAHSTPGVAPRSAFWTPAMGRSAVARAESWLGMPYSWAGGTSTGPTLGRCDPGTGGDLDCHVVGFDCSGLAMYAWGAYLSLPHLASTQQAAGMFHPTVAQLLPGDLVFFSGYLPGDTGHVAIYAGKGMVIEAPQSGSVVQRTSLASVMAEDGTYRGAVRPMSGPTPALTAPRTAVPTAGGTVTLRGAHLLGVDAVHLGTVTVRRFLQHTDSAIVFRAPAHAQGGLALTVSTTWKATSRPVPLDYVRPHRAAPATAPATHAAPPPPSTVTDPAPVRTAPSTPTVPTSPSSTAPSSTAASTSSATSQSTRVVTATSATPAAG